MSFRAAIQPFGLELDKADRNNFYASSQNQNQLKKAIKRQLKLEKGNESIGMEQGQRLANYDIDRSNFLTNIQEYSASLDKNNLEGIYRGTEQTRFNHLIEIHSNVGVYLPIFFFFPMRIALEQNVLPVFIGSAPKLYSELQQLNKSLQAHDHVDLGKISENFIAHDEDLEDYEADYEGVSNFWSIFTYLILESLVKKSLDSQMPLFIY